MKEEKASQNTNYQSKTYCPRGGSIVGGPPYGLVPADPSDVGLGTHDPVIGCNNLLCHACGYPVRSRLSLVSIDPSRVNPKFLYQKIEEEPVGFRVTADPQTRTYVCQCNWKIENMATDLDVRIQDDPLGIFFTSEWRCAGHSFGNIPRDLKEAFDSSLDVPAIIEKLLTVRSFKSSGEHGSSAPCLDLLRWEIHQPEPVRQNVRQEVRRVVLESSCPVILSAALSYLHFRVGPADGKSWLNRLNIDNKVGSSTGPDSPLSFRAMGFSLLMTWVKALLVNGESHVPDRLTIETMSAMEDLGVLFPMSTIVQYDPMGVVEYLLQKEDATERLLRKWAKGLKQVESTDVLYAVIERIEREPDDHPLKSLLIAQVP